MSTLTPKVGPLGSPRSEQDPKLFKKKRSDTPIPGGLSVVGDRIASASSSNPPAPLPKRAKKGGQKTEEAIVPLNTTPQTAPTPLIAPMATSDEQVAFTAIYNCLAYGMFKKIAELPIQEQPVAEQRIGFRGLFKKMGEMGQLGKALISFNWIQLAKDRQLVMEKGENVKAVHPLAFLSFVKSSENVRENLKVVKGYTEAWDARIEKILSRANIGRDAPWTRTVKDFSAKMQVHKDKDTLQLEGFLTQFPEKEQEELKGYVERNEFDKLLEKIVG